MRQKIAIITSGARWAEYLRKGLMRFFSNEVEVIPYNADKNPIRGPVDADLILIAQPIIYYSAHGFFDPATPTVNLSATITKRQYEMVREIPAGTKVLVVNDSESATVETITELQELGLTHIEYFPYTTAASAVDSGVKPTVAITPGESWLVPDYVQQIVDIGGRVIDLPCLTEIAVYLGLEHLLKSDNFQKYASEICVKKNSLAYLLDRSQAVSEVFLSLADSLGEGIAIVDRMGLVQDCNALASTILGSKKTVMGRQIGQLLPCQLTRDIETIHHDSEAQLINFNNMAVSVRVIPINMKGVPCGALVAVNSFEEREKRQRNLRRQILKKGHVAKRNFADIITADPDTMELKAMAEKHARSDATILITGESGTGKEILAQAIHNASPRRSCPFVALNCAALPRELLESELFGYEEGAFTGAKKGGKIGLFELATTGTIFLDEIGDMDLELQARILRVLEEREVLRIGGDTTYPVDIRVIAATNQDLWDLIDKGRFRRDLYYRLNVIPLELKPLRQRSGDVLLLFHRFAQMKQRTFTLTPEAEAYLAAYPWYGNIRELRNWVEYLSVLNIDHLDLEDVRRLLHSRQREGKRPPAAAAQTAAPLAAAPAPAAPAEAAGAPSSEEEVDFWREISGSELSYCLVLGVLLRSRGQGVGRHAIFSQLQQQGHGLSEVEIRRVSQTLARHGMVIQGSGRSGARITPLGTAAYGRMEQDPCLQKMLRGLDK